MTVRDIERYLASVAHRPTTPSSAAVRGALGALKKDAVSREDEVTAKRLWCLEATLGIQEYYWAAFNGLRAGGYYEAWCDFERCEVELGFLSPHFRDEFSAYRLDFIEEHVRKWQALFPYKYFFSTELIEKGKRCSVCGEAVSIRQPCGHVPGEIYRGVHCCRIVDDADVVGIAIVQNPVHKYAVVFPRDPESKRSADGYDYSLVRYPTARLTSPFDGWCATRTTKTYPHSRFRSYSRNSGCPCGSGRKYKRCCLPKEGVALPHVEFEFSQAVSETLREDIVPNARRRDRD